jgi:peptidoglycan/LPS O-acetylase OafA/YrhL
VPGGFGVTVFFFLSGFLITTLLRLEFERFGSVDLRQFWLRRALRILPPFYLVLIAATAAAVVINPESAVSGGAVAARALHFTNYWLIFAGYAGEPPGTGVYWSLAVEEHFYLLFPFLYMSLQKLQMSGSRQAQLLWAICVLVLLWRCVLVFVLHTPPERTYMGSDTRVDSLLFGCALAVWNNPVVDRPIFSDLLWKRAIIPCATLVLGVCSAIGGTGFRETVRYSLQGIALTCVFIAIVRFRRSPAFRLLNWRPVALLGGLSYSLYLIHYTVILGVRRAAGSVHPLLQGLLALGISLSLAWGIYVLIERPCARLRQRFQADDLQRIGPSIGCARSRRTGAGQ